MENEEMEQREGTETGQDEAQGNRLASLFSGDNFIVILLIVIIVVVAILAASNSRKKADAPASQKPPEVRNVIERIVQVPAQVAGEGAKE